MKQTIVAVLLALSLSMQAQPPLRISTQGQSFTLKGDERPIAGESLKVLFGGNLSQYTFRWTRGDALGLFDDTVLSAANDYKITESDYEHWLRVTVCNNAGDTVFTKDTWISRLPVVYIDTEDGNAITSKDNYVSAHIRIQGNAEYVEQYTGATSIKGRGKSSWNYPQKPYKLKLDKKTNLYGFGKNKHWVLLSNFNDKSCLRNHIASNLARQLGVLGMKMTWVDVVLNGEAKGCYMMSQHIRADKNSVDIFDWEGEAEDMANALFNAVKDANALEEADEKLLEETMKQNLAWVTNGKVAFKGKTYNLASYGLKKTYDISKGYLFEILGRLQSETLFQTPDGVRIQINNPEYSSTNSQMMDYVSNLWNNFESAYSKVPPPEGKNFSKYADMKTMVGIWLVNEIMGQGDPVFSRMSYIPDDGKIHFGPVWDFDHSSGSWSTTNKVNIFYTMIHDMEHIYYNKWFPDPILCQMTYDAYWDVARPYVMSVLQEGGEIDTRYAYVAEAGRTNDILWGEYPSLLKPAATPRTTAEDVEELKTFLLGHIMWLDKQFQSVNTLVEALNKVCTYPYDPSAMGITELASEGQTGVRKVIRDKRLYIIKDGMTYSVEGKRIK